MDGRQRRTRGPRLSTADCLERETARDIRVSWPWRKHALRGPRYGVSKLLAGSNRGLSPGFANARNHHGFGREKAGLATAGRTGKRSRPEIHRCNPGDIA